MDDLKAQINELIILVKEAFDKLNINQLLTELNNLTNISRQNDFWYDNLNAQSTMQQISKIELQTTPWIKIKSELEELVDITELNDLSLRSEIITHIDKLNNDLAILKEDLKFNQPFDNNDVIFSIYAGAGGTDAQDWVSILVRMYSRYFDSRHFVTTVLDQTLGDEAGIKSITLSVNGKTTYGFLKSENGVHRLVRLSPFNADHLRQTSFARVEVIPKINAPKDLIIDDKDLKIDVYRSGGHGGQSVNTTDSAVRITHLPTNISVAIQNERSQLQNKELAMTILRSRLMKLKIEQHTETIANLKGPLQSAEWGNQIRSYVMHPYKQVKDLRTKYETSDIEDVLSGNIQPFIDSYLNKY